MLVLLDQNVPIGVRRILAGHDVRTAYGMGWANLSNGELINAAESGGVQVLVTATRISCFSRALPKGRSQWWF